MAKIIQLEGRNVVTEALSSGRKIKKLIIDSGGVTNPKVANIVKLADKKKIHIVYKDRKKLNKMSKTHAHQGVIAIAFEKEKLKLLQLIDDIYASGKDPFFVMIDDLTYEQNLGAIARTAYSAGVDAIIVSHGGAAEVTSVVSHISAGATEYIPIINESLYSAIKKLKENNIKIIGVDKGDNPNYFSADLTGPIALVLGGEDKGVSSGIKDKMDGLISIPMVNDFSSLNVSVAAAIVIYDRVRQLQSSDKKS